MLKVTDEGIKISLNSQFKTPFPLQEILILAILTFINSILGFELNLYSKEVTVLINVIILAIVYCLRYWRIKHQPKILSGGDLLLTNQQLVHNAFGTRTQYQLQSNDTIQAVGETLLIKNQQDKTLYQINGFNDPKHLEVAQAVLNGKTIQTQGKAIKLQSSD